MRDGDGSVSLPRQRANVPPRAHKHSGPVTAIVPSQMNISLLSEDGAASQVPKVGTLTGKLSKNDAGWLPSQGSPLSRVSIIVSSEARRMVHVRQLFRIEFVISVLHWRGGKRHAHIW
jgi:hypothetical protein